MYFLTFCYVFSTLYLIFQSLFALRCRSSHLQKMSPAVAAMEKNAAAILPDHKQRVNQMRTLPLTNI